VLTCGNESDMDICPGLSNLDSERERLSDR
jgi:hypothetical protein